MYNDLEITITLAMLLAIPIFLVFLVLFDDDPLEFEWDVVFEEIKKWRR